jgi:hypothetical protein
MPETGILKKNTQKETVHRKTSWKAPGRPKSRWEDDVRHDLKKMKLMKWADKYRTALNGRILSRRPRLYQSCSVLEEEDNVTQ